MEHLQENTRKSLVRQYIYLRKLKGLTQAELAELAGVFRLMVSKFESGDYNPSLALLVKLAEALDMDVCVTLVDRQV